ncbi:MAG: (Fe-S)-binding protein [Candidatus Baldrarchaeia archaeon]
MEFSNLRKYEDMLYSCSRVGDCRVSVRPSIGKYGVCPVLEHSPGFEVYFARGRILLARGLLEGKIKPTEEVVRVFYQCMVCGSCKWSCNQSFEESVVLPISQIIDHDKIWEAIRADFVEMGIGPMPRHREILAWTRKEYNPYPPSKHADRLKWIPEGEKIPQKGKIVFFVGCTNPYRAPDLLIKYLELMRAAGVEVAINPDLWCCGSIALRVGDRKLGEELARHNVEVLKNIGAEVVVTHCAGCYRTLKRDYPEIVGELPFEVKHTTEHLLELIKDGKLHPEKELKYKVTYHDPCHLGRHCGVFDPPREVIRSVPGIEFTELRRIRYNSWCCGAGGGVKSAFPDLAVKIAKDRIKETTEVKADTLVTACPFCERNLTDAVNAMKSRVRVLDVIDLVHESTITK